MCFPALYVRNTTPENHVPQRARQHGRSHFGYGWGLHHLHPYRPHAVRLVHGAKSSTVTTYYTILLLAM